MFPWCFVFLAQILLDKLNKNLDFPVSIFSIYEQSEYGKTFGRSKHELQSTCSSTSYEQKWDFVLLFPCCFFT